MSTISQEKFNRAFFDPKISFDARGVLIYLIASSGTPTLTDLSKVGPDNKFETYAAIKELLDAGYVSRLQHERKDGSHSEIEYIVCPEIKESFFVSDMYLNNPEAF